MIGLLKNEFLTMRRVIILYTGVLFLYYILGVLGTGMSGVQIFGVFFATMMVISSFSYEEKSGWTSYVNVLPVSRLQIVVSKYLFAMICMLVTAGVGALIQAALNIRNGNQMFQDIWVAGEAVVAASLFLALVLPVLFKVGAEKSRVTLVMIFMIPFAALLIIEKAGIEISFSLENIISLYPVIGAATVLLLLLSCAVSVGIYKRKEF